MNYRIKIYLAVQCFLVMVLLPVNTMAQEVLPPVENVRVENGLVVWNPMEPLTENGRVVYNVYRVFPAATGSPRALYIGTVSNKTEFEPALPGDYIIIASTNGLFSIIDQATPVLFQQNDDGFTELSTQSRYEIRTNRCGDLASGQSCVSACDSTHIPTGGACRTEGAVVIHHRARFNGFECISTADVAFLETDVYCLK